MDAVRLQVLDPNVQFSCHSCTTCCDQPWRTLIEEDKAKALDAHDFSAYPQLAGKRFYHNVKGAGKGYYVLAKGEGNRCLFLDADGLCIIHKEMGPQAKPRPCLGFPYTVARTGTEDRVSVDFGCPSVQNNAGRPLTEQGEDVAAVIRKSRKQPDLNAKVQLDGSIKLPATVADALFDRLIDIFGADRSGDIWQRFAEAIVLLVATQRFVRSDEEDRTEHRFFELLENDEALPDTPELPEIIAYDRPVAAPSPARLLFAATLFRDTAPPDATANAGLLKRLTMLPKLMSLARMSGGYASRVLERNLSVQEAFTHPMNEELDAAGTALLLRYYRSRLWQRCPAGSKLSIIGGVHQHIHDLNAIILFARARALETGESCFSEQLIRFGLQCVELHLANQPRVYDQNRVGWFRAQLDSPSVALASLRLMALKRPIAAVVE